MKTSIMVVLACFMASIASAQTPRVNLPFGKYNVQKVQVIDSVKLKDLGKTKIYHDGAKTTKLNSNVIISKQLVEAIKLQGDLLDVQLDGRHPTDTIMTLLSLGDFSYQQELDSSKIFSIQNDTASSLFILIEFFNDREGWYTDVELKKIIAKDCPGYRHANATDLFLYRLLSKKKPIEPFVRVVAMGDSLTRQGEVRKLVLYPSIDFRYGYSNFSWQWGQFERSTKVLMVKYIPQEKAVELQSWLTPPPIK